MVFKRPLTHDVTYDRNLAMPLPSVKKGATQCVVKCKRTGLQCMNPAAYGCKSCRMHGAHKSRNTLAGENHPQFKHGRDTKQAKERHQQTSTKLHFLEDLGHHIKMFPEGTTRTQGRKPKGYVKLNLSDPIQLAIAISRTIEKK